MSVQICMYIMEFAYMQTCKCTQRHTHSNRHDAATFMHVIQSFFLYHTHHITPTLS